MKNHTITIIIPSKFAYGIILRWLNFHYMPYPATIRCIGNFNKLFVVGKAMEIIMRSAQIERNTKETQIKVELNLDGGAVDVSTGIGFFDHMLTAFGVHGGFGLKIRVNGDLDVDTHHTVEDTGIALGLAFKQALGDMSGIVRYGSFSIPMDEALATCILDISNRAFLVFKASFEQELCGDYETCVTEEFFRAFAVNSAITLHISVPYGANAHHEIEAIFKAVAHAMHIATRKNESGAVLSTKGVL